MKKLIITIMMLAGMVSAAWAQVDDVTLVVSGEGATKDEATTKALRSAIEQAFGVFVSANTEILNDELVRDEIATVSSGNVKKYTELGTINKPNGNIEVSLQATVSVKKLTTYAQKHGSSCEFAGATFAANMKLVELNRENTKKALENLYKQIENVGTDLYTCDIEIKNIRQDGLVQLEFTYYTNENAVTLGELIKSTIEALAIPENVVATLSQQGVPLYEVAIFYYKIGKDLFGNQVVSEHSTAEYLTTYYPVELPSVLGRLYNVYDNLNNQYNPRFLIDKNESYYLVRTIRIRDSETFNIYKKIAMENPQKYNSEVEDFVKKKFPCLTYEQVHEAVRHGDVDFRYMEKYEKNGWQYCNLKFENYPCSITLEEKLTEREEFWEKKELSYNDYKGFIITQERNKIGIPAAYLDCQSKKKKKKDNPTVFKPQHLFTFTGFIQIPPERINQITNLYVK